MSDWFAFSSMRVDAEKRTWLRWSEVWATIKAEFPDVCETGLRVAMRSAARPEKRYGHYRYTTEHLAAARAYAAGLGLTVKGAK
jgi:hypothetical protein